MTMLEGAAAVLLLINVALAARRSVWNYAFALGAVSIYALIFWEERLYSDVILQLIFIALNLYGLVNWRRAREEDGVPVGWMSQSARAGWLAAIIAIWLAWSTAMARLTDAVAPYADGAVLVISVAAQWLMARRRVESWWLWVAVDVIAVPLYLSRGLYVTGAVYGVLLILAVQGVVEWRRAARPLAPAAA